MKIPTAKKVEERVATRKARAKDAMAAEEVVEDLLILKQHVGPTRITSGKIVLTISIVLAMCQGRTQLVVDVVVEIQLDEEDMEAEEAIILKSIILKQLDHHNIKQNLDNHNIQRYLLAIGATKLVLGDRNCRPSRQQKSQ